MAVTGTVRLTAGGSAATISEVGAELREWSVDGRALLWEPDGIYWDRVAPILFPIVGRTRNDRIRVAGLDYPMGVHGFAAASRFSVVSSREDRVHLRLADDATTWRSYPFAFTLDVTFALEHTRLSVFFTVGNPGHEALPYALGFHPGFRMPFAGGALADFRLDFEQAEMAEVPEITPEGFLARTRRRLPLDGRRLSLSEALLAKGALVFLDARSRSLSLTAPDGAAITLAQDGFSHLAIWAKRPAPFLALEAWTGHGDVEGFDGALSERPSMRLLPPAATADFSVALHYENRPAEGKD